MLSFFAQFLISCRITPRLEFILSTRVRVLLPTKVYAMNVYFSVLTVTIFSDTLAITRSPILAICCPNFVSFGRIVVGSPSSSNIATACIDSLARRSLSRYSSMLLHSGQANNLFIHLLQEQFHNISIVIFVVIWYFFANLKAKFFVKSLGIFIIFTYF